MTDFNGLGLIEPLVRAVAAEGYEKATPIQASTIPLLLAGRDVLGLAQTGTGKTAAFSLPILQLLNQTKKRPPTKAPRALILTPTRELALQIGESFATYGNNLPLRRTVIHGGVGQSPQVAALARGTEILVATPGRLLDLMAQNQCRLDHVEIFVLDEADRMLDMGFIRDVRKVVSVLPAQRQTLLFSATMPDAVAELANSILTNAERVEVTPQATTVERISQSVLFVDRPDKRRLLADLLRNSDISRTIVFARTKHGADRVAEHLRKAGLAADSIHGDKSQSARVKALESFRRGELRALVATDIAARGIDIDGISHVINFDLPNEPESYVHRIGRTARAGTEGTAISFCDAEEVPYLKDIEKITRQTITVNDEHPFHSVLAAEVSSAMARPANGASKPRSAGKPGGRSSGRGGRPGNAHAAGGGNARGNQQADTAPKRKQGAGQQAQGGQQGQAGQQAAAPKPAPQRAAADKSRGEKSGNAPVNRPRKTDGGDQPRARRPRRDAA